MKKIKLKEVVYLIAILGLIYYSQGLEGIKKLFLILWNLLKLINMVIVNLTGDTILAHLFSSSITFFIVGMILELFNIRKGKFGKYFGEISFWLIGYPVSFILNLIAKIIF